MLVRLVRLVLCRLVQLITVSDGNCGVQDGGTYRLASLGVCWGLRMRP